MSSEFKQQLKVQMHARQVVSFNSWSEYLKFVTSVQRAVEPDDDSSSNDEVKDEKTSSKKKFRSLVATGGRKTPKDLFPDSPLTSTSEWPVEKDRCVFDFNHVQCPYGEKCTRKHNNNSKSSSSSAATDGSNSPKVRAINVMIRKLSAEKDRLAAQEDERSVNSIDSDVTDPLSDDDSPSNDGGKDATSKKNKFRSLVKQGAIVTTGGQRTPKDLFPDSSLTSTSEWPPEKDRCVFDFNHVQCPYGENCRRKHANTSKSSSSSAATDGSNSPKVRATNVVIRKLSAEKDRLAAQEDERSVNSIDSDMTDPLSDDDRGKFGSSSTSSSDDLGSIRRLLGLDN